VTVRLTVRATMWRSHVAQVASSVDGLVPVVKGNGYGFGRTRLASVAAEFADAIAVGTVHELDGLPDGVDTVVLTPIVTPQRLTGQAPSGPAENSPILTVGSDEHIRALDGWGGRVLVKLVSTMQRFGRGVELVTAARRAGLQIEGVSVHPPLAGTMAEHAADIVDVARDVPPDLPVWVSHLDPVTYRSLPTTHMYRLRLGTMLWHGDKSALHLDTDVIDVRPVAAGQPVGYRLTPASTDGHLVIVGAGTANGVTPLDDGRSPFHHQRKRLVLLEPPHMHVSMAFVPEDDAVPAVGDWLDVQRPLHMTHVDDIRWL
jgi:alanine racemase